MAVAALFLALPALANATTVILKKGTVGGTPWEVKAHSSTTDRLPGPMHELSVRAVVRVGPDVLHRAGPRHYHGRPALGVSRHRRFGVRGTFTARDHPRGRFGPVDSVLRRSADTASRRVARGWGAVTIAWHPVPGSFHRPDAFAVAVTAHAPRSHSAVKVVRAVAYDAHGHVVGRMSTKKALGLPIYTYG